MNQHKSSMCPVITTKTIPQQYSRRVCQHRTFCLTSAICIKTEQNHGLSFIFSYWLHVYHITVISMEVGREMTKAPGFSTHPLYWPGHTNLINTIRAKVPFSLKKKKSLQITFYLIDVRVFNVLLSVFYGAIVLENSGQGSRDVKRSDFDIMPS